MNFKNCFMIIAMVLLIIQPINASDIEYKENFTINEAEEFMLNVDAYDPDEDDILSYYFSPPLDENGTWTPGYEDAGEYNIEVRVSDGDKYDSFNITIFVEETDRAPIIIATGKQKVYEGSNIEVKLDAFDPDGDNVSFKEVDLPKNAYIENNTLYWTPSYTTVKKSWINKVLNFYRIDIFEDVREVSVKISAQANELSTNGEIPVDVVNVNQPPVIDEMDDIFIEETDTLYLEPSATDIDQDFIRYFYSGFVNKNKYKTTYEDAGNHTVTVMASDGLASSSTEVNVFVENINRLPDMEEIGKVKVYENQTLKINLMGHDPDKDELLFDIDYFSDSPEDSYVQNNTFYWTPDFDFVSSDEVEKQVNINFSVWDGQNYDVEEANINVIHVNRAPFIYNYTPEHGAYELYVDQYMIFSINASDLDGDNITYKWNFGLVDRKIDSPIIKRIFRRPGMKKITAVASDGLSEVRKSWLIKVNPPIEIPKESEKQKLSEPGPYYEFEIPHNIEEQPEPEEKADYYEFWIY